MKSLKSTKGKANVREIKRTSLTKAKAETFNPEPKLTAQQLLEECN